MVDTLSLIFNSLEELSYWHSNVINMYANELSHFTMEVWL